MAGPHNPITVVGITFLILKDTHNNFLGDLKTECNTAPGLMVARIAAVMDFLALKGLISARQSSGVTGKYPFVSPSAGEDWESIRINTQNNLQALNIPKLTKQALEAAIGAQDAMLMLGFDKVIGALTSTATGAYSYAKVAHTTYDTSMKVWDFGTKYTELYEACKKVRFPAKAFIAAM